MGLRFGFSEYDLSNLRTSQSASERAAEMVGLDAEEIQKVVEERMLGGARNVESHFGGGIASWETDLVKAVRANSDMAEVGVPLDAEAPFMAAAARRVRFRQATHDGLEVIQHLESEQEQLDLEAK